MVESTDTPTLAQLFARIELRDWKGRTSRFSTLASLISCCPQPEGSFEDLRSVRDTRALRWYQYCGVGTFQVPARRLVDLWMELNELGETLKSLHATEKKENAQESSASIHIANRVHAVLRRHWRRIVDADPFLLPDTRQRLKDEGPQACTVIPAADVVFSRELEIVGAALNVSAGNTKRAEVTYQARLYLAAELQPGSGVPAMAVLGRRRNRDESQGTGPGGAPGSLSGSSEVPIEYLHTRCAKVLYDDLEELFHNDTTAIHEWRSLTSVTPVVLYWIGPEGEAAHFAWPLPPLPTFADLAVFLARWKNTCEAELSKSGATPRPAQSSSSHSPSTQASAVSVDVVTTLVQRWLALGLKSVEESLQDSFPATPSPIPSLSETASWDNIADRLFFIRQQAIQHNHLRASTQLNEWSRRTAQLIQPEYCSPAVSRELISKVESLTRSDELKVINDEFSEYRRNQRRDELAPIWNRGATGLWRALNQPPTGKEGSWLFLGLDEPAPEREPEVLSKLGDLERRIGRMQRELRTEFQRSEFVSLVRQGDLAAADDPQTAARLYQLACEAAQRMVDASPKSNQAQRDLSLSLTRIGENFERLQRWSESEQMFQRALEIDRRLAAGEPQNLQAQRDLLVSLNKIGNIHIEQGRWVEGEQAYEEALNIARNLVQAEPNSNQALDDLAASLEKIGDIYVRRDRWTDAEAAFTEALKLRRQLGESDPKNIQAQRAWSIPLERMGDIHLHQERWARAEQSYADALRLRRQLNNANPQNAQARRELSVSLTMQGDIFLLLGRLEDAEQAYAEALELDRTAPDIQSSQAQRDLSVSLTKLGDLYVRRENWTRAEAAYQEALKIRRRLNKSEPESAQSRRDLAVSLERMGSIQARLGQWTAAEKSFQAALEIARQLAQEDPTSREARRDLCDSLSKMGSFHLRQQRRAQARPLFEESLSIAEQLASSDPQDKLAQRDCAKYAAKLAATVPKVADRRALRQRAWSLLVEQDPIAIRSDIDLVPVYDDLKAEFSPPASVESPPPASKKRAAAKVGAKKKVAAKRAPKKT